MRYLLLVFLLFSSFFSFAQQPSVPSGCVEKSFYGGQQYLVDAYKNSCMSNASVNLILTWFNGSTPYIGCYSCPQPCQPPLQINPVTKQCDAPCPQGQVRNLNTGMCEIKNECVYPQLYDWYSNSCIANPNNCAIGAKPNPLSPGTCMATEPTSCPAGWALSADALTCSPSGSASSGAANSSAPSNTSSVATTSTPSNTSSAATASSASNTSGTNTSSGGGSGGGPGNGSGGDNGGGSNSSSGSNNSWTPHSGYGNWIPISENSPCPNKYQDANGQWWCSAANTGTASSAAGQCDPTAKDYLACISQGAGTASSSGANSSACNPSSADYQQCLASSQAGTKMKELGDKFKEDTDKEMDKFKKAVDDDLSNFQRDGLTFKDEPSRLRSLLTSFLPVATACNPPPLKLFGRSYNLDCYYFNIFKQALGWLLAIITAFNIWQLATRPVDR